MTRLTPLRYPGGKAKLARFFMLLAQRNALTDMHYVEPYAGGAGVALALLFEEYASHIYINDINPPIFSFWHTVLNQTDYICRRILETEVCMEEWYRQKEIVTNFEDNTIEELGFATFFLNRTNHSGIINAGIIGGREQTGIWKMDARYNKRDLIQRIEKIANFRTRIHLYNDDAVHLLENIALDLPQNTLIYLDPPYYVKGQNLYQNFYQHQDHETIAHLLQNMPHSWVVSYDNVEPIRMMYANYRMQPYNLSYTASRIRQQGSEVMIFSENLNIPEVEDPINIPPRLLTNNQAALRLEL